VLAGLGVLTSRFTGLVLHVPLTLKSTMRSVHRSPPAAGRWCLHSTGRTSVWGRRPPANSPRLQRGDSLAPQTNDGGSRTSSARLRGSLIAPLARVFDATPAPSSRAAYWLSSVVGQDETGRFSKRCLNEAWHVRQRTSVHRLARGIWLRWCCDLSVRWSMDGRRLSGSLPLPPTCAMAGPQQRGEKTYPKHRSNQHQIPNQP